MQKIRRRYPLKSFIRTLSFLFLVGTLLLPVENGFCAPIKQQKTTRQQAAQKKRAAPAKKTTIKQSSSQTKKKTAKPATKTAIKAKQTAKKRGAVAAPVAAKPSHQQAHLLGRLYLGNCLQANLFQNNTWLLPMQTPPEAARQLSALQPQFITGIIRLSPGTQLHAETINTWALMRNTIRHKNPNLALDLTLDLRQFKKPEDVTAYMRETAQLLTAEAWTFDGASSVYETQPGVLQAALAEAHAQRRFAGGVLLGQTIPPGLDYGVISTGAKAENLNQTAPLVKKAAHMRTPGKNTLAILALAGATTTPGTGFAQGKPPSDRRILVQNAAKEQRPHVSFAYPVFGPMAMKDKAYDATRDEFMLDTIKRCQRSYNKNSAPALERVTAGN